MIAVKKNQPEQINKEKFKVDIFYAFFRGNVKSCAAGLGISVTILSSFLNNNTIKSHTLPAAVTKYCKSKGLDPNAFINSTQ